jgi:hypothetical protein
MTGRHADAIVALLLLILGATLDGDPDRPLWSAAAVGVAAMWIALRAIGHRATP